MTVHTHRTFGLLLGLVFMAVPAESRGTLSPERLYQRALPSVMTLEVETQSGEKFVGSAVLALADDIALTAWHVVCDARSVRAVFADGLRVQVIGCVDHDSTRDLALLKLDRRLPRRRASLCREQPSVAARAYVIGAPKGLAFSISDGLISQIRSVDGFVQYQLSCPISPGSSGSPILNDRGEVIGIASWTKADAQNVSFAIPTQEFIRHNVSGPIQTWAELAAAGRAATPAGLIQPGPTAATMQVDDGAGSGDFAAFQKVLKASAGREVTVVVRADGRTNTFRFTAR